MSHLDGYWQGYTDGHVGVPHAKNNPKYLYRNPQGPVPTVIPEPRRLPPVYNRWFADPWTKAALRWSNRWLFCNRKMRLLMTVVAAVTVEKFWTQVLNSIVRYNNMECTMEYAYRKEREWKEHVEAEEARKAAEGGSEDSMSPDLYLQDDLHAWLEQSLHDFIAIKKIKEKTQSSMLGGSRKEDLLKKKLRIEKAVEDFEAKANPKGVETARKTLAIAQTMKRTVGPRSESAAAGDYQKNSGREYLQRMVKNAARRVQAARAGRTISNSILDEDRASPPILRSLLVTATSRDRSSPDSLRGSAKSALGLVSDEYHSKPHVSFTSGKLEPALQLPTFPEYCASLNIDMVKGTSNMKLLRKAEEAIARLKNFERKMNEAEKGVKKREAAELRVTRRLQSIVHPTSHPLAPIPTPPSTHRKVRSMMIEEERVRYEKECEMTKAGVQHSHDAISERLRQFQEQRINQNQRTIDIMDRVQMEKAFILRKKIKLVHADTEHFKDYGRVIGKFGEIKQSTEIARRSRIEHSKKQAKMHNAMLEVLRVQEDDPSDTQLLLLESVRRVLEEGWTLQASDYFLVIVTQILERLPPVDLPCPNLRSMLYQLRRHLGVSESEQTAWEQRTQSISG